MCRKPVFHPTGPCCGEPGLCARWPKIDWSKFAWKLTQPHATTVDQRYAWHSYANSPVVLVPLFNGDGEQYGNEIWAGVVQSIFDSPADNIYGTVIVDDVYVSWHSYHYRGNDYRSIYNGNCQWTVYSAERLLFPRNFMVELDGGSFFRALSFEHFSNGQLNSTMQVWTPSEWSQVRAYNDSALNYPPFGDTPIDVYNLGANQIFEPGQGSKAGLSWRAVLQAVACTLRPLAAANDWSLSGYVIAQTDLAEDYVRSPTVPESLPEGRPTNNGGQFFYRPTAMDLAVAFTLEPGHILKVVDGELKVFSDVARWYGGLNPNPTYSPWALISHEMVEAEPGRVHRFERTDNNVVLPDWIELELVRI